MPTDLRPRRVDRPTSVEAAVSESPALPPLSDTERARLNDLLNAFGMPPERHDEYLALVTGCIAAAFDAYFAELKEGA